jgi:hypothetical protein
MSAELIVLDTRKGPVHVFENEAPQPDDPYLAAVGWFYQELAVDEGPVGPFASLGELEQAL